jgi:hypothetical protein
MNKKIYLTLSVVCLTLFLNGCFNQSKLPLSKPENAQQDKSLAGAWHATIDGHDVYLHAIPYPEDRAETKAWMQLVHVAHPKSGSAGKGEDAVLLNMFPTAAAGRKFMNVLFRRPRQAEVGLKEVEEYYWFWKYEVSKDGVLTVWELDEEALRLALENEKLKGGYRKAGLVLEDSSENMLAFLLSDEGEKAFRLYGQFRKVR